MHKLVKNLDGTRFGYLVATNKIKHVRGLARRLCHCDCGKKHWVATARLINGSVKSCGCEQGGGNKLPCGIAARNRVLKNYKRHAKDRRLIWRLSDTEFDALTAGSCHFCGRQPHMVSKPKENTGNFVYNGIDRKNNLRGYEIDNVVSCCKVCNRAKNNMRYADFKNWIQDLVVNNRGQDGL